VLNLKAKGARQKVKILQDQSLNPTNNQQPTTNNQ